MKKLLVFVFLGIFLFGMIGGVVADINYALSSAGYSSISVVKSSHGADGVVSTGAVANVNDGDFATFTDQYSHDGGYATIDAVLIFTDPIPVLNNITYKVRGARTTSSLQIKTLVVPTWTTIKSTTTPHGIINTLTQSGPYYDVTEIRLYVRSNSDNEPYEVPYGVGIYEIKAWGTESLVEGNTCSENDTIMKLSQPINGLGAIYSESAYTWDICCSTIFGEDNDVCSPDTFHPDTCANPVGWLGDAAGSQISSAGTEVQVCYGELECRATEEDCAADEEVVIKLTDIADSNVLDPNYGGFVPASVVSLWKFDGDSGTIALDSQGSNNGTLMSMNDADWVDGQVGTALDFDGVNDYVSVPDNDSLDLSVYSTEAWVNLGSFPADKEKWGILVHGEGTDGVRGYGMRVGREDTFPTWDNRPRLYCDFEEEEDDADYRLAHVIDNSYLNKYVHVVCTLNGNDWKMYIDGVDVGASVYNNGGEMSNGLTGQVPDATISRPVYIGAVYRDDNDGDGDNTVGWFFNGTIDEVAIYDAALTAEEVQQRYNEGLVDLFDVNVCCKKTGAGPVLSWEDMDGNLITEANLGNQVRMVRTGEASGDFEIFNGDGDDIHVGDDKIQGVEDDGNLVGVWTITPDDFVLGIADDDDYIEAVFKIGGEPSGVLKVFKDGDDKPMVVTLEEPLCADVFLEGETTWINVTASDPTDKIIGNISIDGVNIMNFSNEVKSTLYKWDRAGNVQVELFAINSKGYLRRTITSVMVVELDVERDYVAACISKPVDFSDITSRKVEFDASNSKGLRCGADDSKIEDCGTVYAKDLWFSWRFSDGLINSNHEGSNELSYAFFKNFATAGHNWAILDVEMR